MDHDSNSLEFGTHIKPPIESLEQVKLMVETIYGITVEKIKELNGYDDKNYHIFGSNKNINNLWPYGYVFKIMNSLDSKDFEFVDAQNKLMLHIASQGIPSPEPIKNKDGKYYSIEQLKNENTGVIADYVVRLLKFQPGIILKNIKCSWSELENLFYEVGRNAAILNRHMKEFKHPAYEKRTSLWQLQNAPQVKNYLLAVNNNVRIKLVQNVIEEFENILQKKLNCLQKGLIHGDLNESNILIEQCSDKTGGYKICAIIDYGDSHISYYLLELAIIICYMTVLSGSLDSGAFVLKGYNEVNPLPVNEYKLLPVCVCARLCQSLVLGLHTFKLNPSNHYVLQTQEAGWKVLNEIASSDKERINKIWMKYI